MSEELFKVCERLRGTVEHLLERDRELTRKLRDAEGLRLLMLETNNKTLEEKRRLSREGEKFGAVLDALSTDIVRKGKLLELIGDKMALALVHLGSKPEEGFLAREAHIKTATRELEDAMREVRRYDKENRAD